MSLRGDPFLEYGNSMPTHVKSSRICIDGIFQFWAWVLLAWSLYRYFFHFSEAADELLFKPLIFFVPVIIYVRKYEKRSLESIGFTKKNLFPSIYIGLAFGFLFALEGLTVNYFKNGTLTFEPIEAFRQYGMMTLMGLSFFTAIWEETLNRGFIFNRILEGTGNLVYSALIASVLFVLLHVPILVTNLNFDGSVLALYFLTNFLLGYINNYIFANTRSVVAPILIHLFWNMTVALYL